WTGKSSSWVDLNPVGASRSYANDTAGAQQTGVAYFGTKFHAGIWSGSSNSWVDLNPIGAENSEAYATTGRFQAGRIYNPSQGIFQHAGIWRGTAASWFDLHPYLPQGTAYSLASV